MPASFIFKTAFVFSGSHEALFIAGSFLYQFSFSLVRGASPMLFQLNFHNGNFRIFSSIVKIKFPDLLSPRKSGFNLFYQPVRDVLVKKEHEATLRRCSLSAANERPALICCSLSSGKSLTISSLLIPFASQLRTS